MKSLKDFFKRIQPEKDAMPQDDGKFIVKKITNLKDLSDGSVKDIPESDVTIQTSDKLIQLSHIDNDKEREPVVIKPGSFIIEDSTFGTKLKKFPLRQYELLETIDNTSIIFSEAHKFFDKLDVYKKLRRDPKRSILLCSPPGVGKTAAINKVCETLLKKAGTAVIVWDTADIRSTVVNRLFLHNFRFSPETKKLVLIIEDITGGTVEDHYGSRGVDTSLLNLLDGIGNPFKQVPTFIIATTNNPEQSVGALIDRPGRFDKVIEMKTPNASQSIQLLEFLSKKKLSEKEKEAAKAAAKNKFSIAHLQEIVVRSLLDDITFTQAVDELINHKKRFQEAFQDSKKLGIGIGRGD